MPSSAPPPSPRIPAQIRKVGVLGAGTMGSRIAAHIANAGIPVVLLDIVPPDGTPATSQSKLALTAIENLRTTRPPAFYTPASSSLIAPGNLEDDLFLLADCDWIIEAVAEDLDIKHILFDRIHPYRRPDCILTTNTSGIPIATIAHALAEEARPHFFGAHFFNPPRYMHLLELIPTKDTDPSDLATLTDFCDKRLGKTIVRAHDTPNFIANRIGTFAMANAMRLMIDQGLSIEEVDTLTGTPIGWPKTGTFRLGDLVGVDVLAHVASNFAEQAADIGDERTDLVLPSFVIAMLKNRWLGDKVGQGFYKKMAQPDGRKDDDRSSRQFLDWRTLEYKPTTRPKFRAVEMAKNVEQTGARIAQLLLHAGDPNDKAFAFYWPFLTELFTYAANRVPEIADTIVEIDQAMKAGFNWELGPFEMMDAAGVRATTDRMRSGGSPISQTVEKLLASSQDPSKSGPTWYRNDPATPAGRQYFDPLTSSYKPVVVPAGITSLATIKRARGVVRKNPGASVIDLGNGVAAIELHSKMNALGDDIVGLITQTLRPSSRQVADFDAFVITGDSANFSVGANLLQLLLVMQDEEWDEVELAVRAFQNMTQAIKYCPRPVVVAAYGMCLGGGTEISLHAAARQPHAELYMGLVEAGVGLIPGGGGCKEMLLRALESGSDAGSALRPDGVEVFNAIRRHFESIAKATVSTSAGDARLLGFLRPADAITSNRGRLLNDAMLRARSLADAGYTAPIARTAIPVPGASILANLKLAAWTLLEGHYISEHDAKVANWVAFALSGGNVAPGTLVSEQYLLDFEREAFLSLCGERKTQERIAFTLKTGKPLRN